MDVRTTLGTVPGAIIGPTTRDICSSELALVVALRGGSGGYKPAKLKIQTRATSYEGLIDKDKLTLECVPAS
jgi:hypothetical protein